MVESWVVNASPLICLAKANCLDLLSRMAPRIVVPHEVIDEVLAGPANDPARREIETGFGERVAGGVVPASIQAWGLGAGESAVLAVGLEHPGSQVVLDDGQARMCARFLGLRLIGTLGIILRARHVGLIEQAAPIVRRIVAAGLHVDERVVRHALRRAAGEDWS